MCKTVEILNVALRILEVQRTTGVTLEQALSIIGYEEQGKAGLRRSAEFRPQSRIEMATILAREAESKRRDAKLEHLRATNHGHLFGENRCCDHCGLLEATYRMEHEHLELDKVITCQDRIDRFMYDAYLGIGIYKRRVWISDVAT